MRSKWFNKKEEALKMRRKGVSIKTVEKKLGIARSTLSWWFRDVQLTKKQCNRLTNNWKNALIKAREKAVRWHNKQKEIRLDYAKHEAEAVLKKIKYDELETLELALAILYLGEGSKKTVSTSIGNTDPLILEFFITSISRLYNLDVSRIRCELHLRADQVALKEQKWWARRLKLPIKNFTSVILDQRTKGRSTYANYHGVCVIQCGTVAIQRKLVYLSRMFCEKVIADYGPVAQLVRARR